MPSMFLFDAAANKVSFASRLLSGMVSSLAIAGLALVAGSAQAQTSGVPVKIVVPSTPGGGSDVLARLLADQIGRSNGPTMVIENRPGASNTIGAEVVARAAPDGNTLLITTPEFVITPHLRKLNYDPLTSFEPVCYLVRSPQAIVVNAASPYRTLADLLDAARAKPGQLTLASAGPASSPHIAIERLKRAADISITYVPYQGSGPAVNALLGEHLTAVFASYPNVVEPVRSGRLRALAVASLSRIEQLPDAPTVIESGFKDYEADLWYGVVAPAKTPPEAISQLARWFSAAIQEPGVKAKLLAQGLFPVGTCGAGFGDFLRKQYDDFGAGIQAGNIKAQ
jgi:tripartite-type tricarboxylate transporter receptor subunit TctC